MLIDTEGAFDAYRCLLVVGVFLFIAERMPIRYCLQRILLIHLQSMLVDIY